jgi:hypothetical protein
MRLHGAVAAERNGARRRPQGGSAGTAIIHRQDVSRWRNGHPGR